MIFGFIFLGNRYILPTHIDAMATFDFSLEVDSKNRPTEFEYLGNKFACTLEPVDETNFESISIEWDQEKMKKCEVSSEITETSKLSLISIGQRACDGLRWMTLLFSRDCHGVSKSAESLVVRNEDNDVSTYGRFLEKTIVNISFTSPPDPVSRHTRSKGMRK